MPFNCDTSDERREKWNKFVADYNALLDRYEVELDFGCGCCKGDHTMGGGEVDEYAEGWSRLDA